MKLRLDSDSPWNHAPSRNPGLARVVARWLVRGRTHYPLLFDRILEPKTAFESVVTQVE